MPSTRFPRASGSNEVKPGSQILLDKEQKQGKNTISNDLLIHPPKHFPKWKSYTHNCKEVFNDLRISFKVPIVNGLNKLFSDFNDLLFACCQRKASKIRKHIFFRPFPSFPHTQSHTMSFAPVMDHLSEHSRLNAWILQTPTRQPCCFNTPSFPVTHFCNSNSHRSPVTLHNALSTTSSRNQSTGSGAC